MIEGILISSIDDTPFMLSDTKLRTLKPKDKPYKVADERGLYVHVSTSGARLWRFKYKFAGKEKLLSLGQYPDVPLSLARERRDEARKLLARAVDPSAEKKASTQAGKNTFAAVFDEWWNLRKESLGDKTSHGIRQRTEVNVLPFIGQLPVDQVTAPAVLDIARRIEARGNDETARRVIQIIGQVMRYAVATGRAEIDPTPSLRGALKPKMVKHHAAILDRQILASFLRAASAYPASPVVRAALLLQVLLFVRPGELRQAEWTEIDWDKKMWDIPGEKMKGRRTERKPHFVPLSTQAVSILRDLQKVTGGCRYVFPSPRTIGTAIERPMSENAVTVALRALGFDQDTVCGHGFRATARTLLDEELRYRVEVIEMQLAHTVRDPLGGAYNRTKFIEERTQMMHAWGNWLWKLVGLARL